VVPCCCGGVDRRAFLTAILGAIGAACAGPTASGTSRRVDGLMTQAESALRDSPVVDLHSHPGRFILTRVGEVPRSALTEMAGGGVDAAFFAAVGDLPVIRREANGIRNFRDPEPHELYRSGLAQVERVVARAKTGELTLIREPGDVAAARSAGRRAALLALEGGDGLEGRPERVREFFALGVRSIQLVHYRINELGDIQTDQPRHGGLTTRGADVVAEMNRLGVVVDGAHADAATLRAILAASRTPIVVSHTGPWRVRRFRRHLDDDLLKAVAAQGGVVGIWPLAQPGSSIDGFLAELEYVRQLIGIDHVGFGTDMTGMADSTSIPSYLDFKPVPAALLARGFSEDDLRKLLGGNVLRVMEAVAAARTTT